MRDPEWNRMDAAHTCGQVCGRSRTDRRPDCTHRCTLLCHPGPCPPCAAHVNRYGVYRNVASSGHKQ